MTTKTVAPAEIGQAMFELHHQMHRIVDQAMCSIGLSLARAKVLFRLSDEGPMNQATLAGLLGYAPRSVTDSVDTLVRDGLVTRQEDERDRRSRIVALTADGKEAVERARETRLAVMKDIFGSLTSSQRAELLALLDTIRTNLPAGDSCVQ